jgi:hypothetical protein
MLHPKTVAFRAQDDGLTFALALLKRPEHTPLIAHNPIFLHHEHIDLPDNPPSNSTPPTTTIKTNIFGSSDDRKGRLIIN